MIQYVGNKHYRIEHYGAGVGGSIVCNVPEDLMI